MDRARRSLLAAALVLLAGAAGAVDGRDFAALYEPTDVTRVGSDALLTFSADLFNYSGEAIAGATVQLRGFLYPEQVYASFPAVDIAENAHTRLTQEVTVPAQEYEAWQRGLAPRLSIEYVDAAGDSRQATAETSRGILGEEGP